MPTSPPGWRLALAAACATTLVATMVTAASAAVPAAAAAPPIGVDLSTDTGPVFHGASGALYGLAEDGVPGADLLAPLHVRTIAQKPPGGLQHPTGDADKVASEFVSAGGQWIFVYVQDFYSQWPYQNLGLSDFVAKVEATVRTLTADPNHAHYVYVPFNEPDWIWYGLNTSDAAKYPANRDHFLADWSTVYNAIRAIDPHALIAGPNEAYYDSRFIPDFLSYAKANGVLPDVMSWHELGSTSPHTYRASYASYRALEKQDGIGPLPINIDEYALRYDKSNPGLLVQWIAMLEDTKVFGDLPFWDIADNYSDNAVRNAEPNGSWWLYRWYASLTGHTVQVRPPQPDVVDSLQGVAAVDPAKHQARVIVSQPAGGDAAVAVSGIDSAVFSRRVHVSVQSTTWTGYDGVASTPLDVAENTYPVVNGRVTVPLSSMDPMAAYQLVITPATAAPDTVATTTWRQRYEAEGATLTDATVYNQGSLANPYGYATSGNKDVGSIDQPDSRVAFSVTVPRDGRYLLSVYHGNQTESVSQQIMRVDSQPWQFINYPATLNWVFRSHVDSYLDLTAGTHTITFGVSDPSIGTAKGQVTLDRIDLASAPRTLPGITAPATRYSVRDADLCAGATVTVRGGHAVTPAGCATGFAVQVSRDGYYALRLRHAGVAAGFQLVASGTPVKASAGNDVLWLHTGINDIEYVPRSAGLVDELDVTPVPVAARSYQAEAPRNTLSGTAVVQDNSYASGGKYVGWIGNGAANTLTFTGIHATRAGTYRIAVSYADNERAGSGNYNANLVDRGMTVTTSGGTQETVYARNTYSWDQFDTIDLTVTLRAGDNTITFGNAGAFAPNIDKITVAPAYLP